MLDSVFIINDKYEILYSNEVGANLCNQTPKKLVRTKSIFTHLFKFDPEIVEIQNLSLMVESLPYKEVHFQTTENTQGRIQFTIQPLLTHPNQWLIYMRDVDLEARLQMKYHRELDQKQDVITQLEKAKIELEKYSQNLEKMVDERTQEIQSLNHTMQALLDSLSQGFFIFNKNGQCLNISSKACLQTLEKNPNGLSVYEALNISPPEIEKFKKWTSTLFMEMLPFEDLAPLGPSHFAHTQNKEIRLEYYPIRSANNEIEGVVTVSTDITKLIEAEKEVLIEKARAKMIVNLVQNKKSIKTFIKDTQHFLDKLKSELQQPTPNTVEIFRYLHTIKGGASMYSIPSMVNPAHEAEEILQNLIKNPNSASLSKLKDHVHHIETNFSNFLKDVTNILGQKVIDNQTLIELSMEDFLKTLEKASKKSTAPQACEYLHHQILMEPIENYFHVYQKAIDKAAEETGKKLFPLQLINGQLSIFPEPYLPLFNVLVHAFRNSVDHGIETPELRQEKGKPEQGQIQVTFERQDPMLKFTIQDDGQGINPTIIRKKLTEKGIPFVGESDQEVIQHIFDPLFSTRDQVTETSGRGVGMDAIKFEVDSLKGRIWVESNLGYGTQVFIEVPYYDISTSFGKTTQSEAA
mgnify:CR=1 FL=1